jgi:hypothetical protein
MISRAFAVWLVTLIVLPFTAPFATYEAPASRSGSTVRSLTDQTTAHALPVARTVSRSRTRIKTAVSTAGATIRLALPIVSGCISQATATTRSVSAPLVLPLRI